jgi:uncharacterized delta-60 repeat protein
MRLPFRVESTIAPARRSVANRASLIRSQKWLRRALVPVVEILESRMLLSAATLDPSFSGDGKLTTDFGNGAVDQAFRVRLTSGKILVAGQSGTDLALARYTSAGALDSTFSGDGKLTLNLSPAGSASNVDVARALAITADGKYLVAGEGNGDFAVARYNSDGTIDTGFGGGDGIATADFFGKVGAGAYGMTTTPGGKIVLVGHAFDGTDYDLALARFNSDGTLDTTFGVGGAEGNGKVTYDFAGQSDNGNAIWRLGSGRLLVAATVTWADADDETAPADSDAAVLRFLPNGTLDKSFATGGSDGDGIATVDFTADAATSGYTNDYASALDVSCTGDIYLTGTVTGTAAAGYDYDAAVARLKSTGAIDTTFGGGDGKITIDFAAANDYGNAIDELPDGKILVAGSAQSSDGNYRLALTRLISTGGLDTTFTGTSGKTTTDFATGTTDLGNSMAVSSDGKIIVAGAAGNDFAVVRYTGGGTFNDGRRCAARTLVPKSAATADTIGDAADADLYAIDVDAGQTLTFDVDRASGSALNSLLRLFDSNGVALISNDNANAPGETSAAPTDSYIKYTFPKTGTYYVGVSSTGNASYDPVGGANFTGGKTTGGYALTVGDATVASAADSDDTLTEAVSTAVGSTKSTTISGGSDVDVYKFTVTAGQTVGFDVDLGSGSTLNSYLRVFNASGDAFAINDDGAASGESLGKASYVSCKFASAGTYYVAVSSYANVYYDVFTGQNDYGGSATTGSYSLVLTNVTTSTTTDTSDQTTEASSISIGSSVTSSIVSGTDVNVYKFTVTAGQKIGFDVDATTGSRIDSYLRVFNSSGTQLTSNHHGAATGETLGSTSYVEYTFTSAGTYYVAISSYANVSYNVVTGSGDVSGATTGGYSLYLVNKNVTATDTNDTISESSSITIGGATVSGSVTNSTDVNVYRFTVTGGRTIEIDVDGATFDSYVRVFDANGVQVVYNNDGAAPGETVGKSSFVRRTFTTGGTYYFAISGNPNTSYNVVNGTGDVAGATGSYTVNVKDVTAPTGDTDDQISEATYLPLSYSAAGAVNVATDVDMFSIRVTAAGNVRFDVDPANGSSLNSYLRLFNSSGTQIASNDNAAAPGEALGTSAYLSYNFTTPGSYFVAVSGSGNSGYSATAGTGDTSGSTGGYLLTANFPNNADPDDQIPEARPLSIGAAAKGDSISNSTDVDLYRFTVSAGQTIAFDLDLTTGSSIDSYLWLRDGQGYTVGTNNDAAAPGESRTTTASYLEHTFNAGGTYYAGVSGYPNYGYSVITGSGDTFGSTGGYTIALSNVATQDPDDQLGEAHAIAIGGSDSDTIDSFGDVDLYKFTVPSGKTIAFDLDLPTGSTLDSYLWVHDSEGYTVSTNNDSGAPGESRDTGASYLEHTFKTGGTFYFGISSYTNYNYDVKTGGRDVWGTTKGAYTVSLSDVGAQDGDDQIGEARTVSIGGSVSEAISTRGDVDLFKFTVSAGQTIAFDVDGTSGSTLDAYLWVRDADGYTVDSNDNYPAPGETAGSMPYLSHKFTKGGTYYVGISSYFNYNYDILTGGRDVWGATTGGYTLHLRLL